MKTRELSGDIEPWAQQIWSVLYKKETDVLSNARPTGRPRKTTVVGDRNIVRAVKKETSVRDMTNDSIVQGWTYHNPLLEEDSE